MARSGSGSTLLGPLPLWQQIALQLMQLALVTLLLWSARHYLPWGIGFDSKLQVLGTFFGTILRVVLVVVLSLALVFVLVMTAGTHRVNYQRHAVGPLHVGLTLPTVTLQSRSPKPQGAPVLLLFGPVQPGAATVFLRPSPSTVGRIDPRSMMGDVADYANVVTVEYPRYGMNEESGFIYIASQLEELGLADSPLIVVGSSMGTMYGQSFLSWLHTTNRPFEVVGFVSVYPFGGGRHVKLGPKLMMRAMFPYTANPVYTWLMLYTPFGGLVAPEEPDGRLRAKDTGWLPGYEVMRQDNLAYPGNFLANMCYILRKQTLVGEPTADSYPVFILFLPTAKDAFLNGDAAADAMGKQYTQNGHGIHAIEIREGGHGQTADFGPYYRGLMNSIFMQLFPGLMQL